MKSVARMVVGNYVCKKLYKICVIAGWMILFWNVLPNLRLPTPAVVNNTRQLSAKLLPREGSTDKQHTSFIASKNDSFVAMVDRNVYVYSAHAINSSSLSFWYQIELNGWERRSLYSANYTCCVVYDNDFADIAMSSMVEKRHWYFMGKSLLEVKQFICRNVRHIEKKVPVAVTLTNEKSCILKDKNEYVKVELPKKQPEETIAVCAKIIYGNISASEVMEWFEYQRLMKVDKIIAYTYQLNKDAMRVLDYYVSTGLGEHYPFDFPDKATNHRSVGVKKFQSWKDEQISVYDCQGRLAGYTYIGLYDIDEYIYPKKDSNYLEMLTNLRNGSPRASGFTFRTEVYATTWGKTDSNSSHPVTIGRYTQRTASFRDRVKSIVINERMHSGRLSTHGYWQKPPFKRHIVKEDIATLKHYRSCRKEWLRHDGGKCYKEITRIVDNTMLPVADTLQKAVKEVKHILQMN